VSNATQIGIREPRLNPSIVDNFHGIDGLVSSALCFAPRRRLQDLQCSTAPHLPTNASAVLGAAWKPMRQAGAIARTMLVSAAAKRWNVDPAPCRAQSGEVLHAPVGRSIKYGELAAAAARMPVPASVALKRREDFKLIGTPASVWTHQQGQRNGRLWGMDVSAAGREDRDTCAIARLRRSCEERG
jgi:hypothetical protein